MHSQFPSEAQIDNRPDSAASKQLQKNAILIQPDILQIFAVPAHFMDGSEENQRPAGHAPPNPVKLRSALGVPPEAQSAVEILLRLEE